MNTKNLTLTLTMMLSGAIAQADATQYLKPEIDFIKIKPKRLEYINPKVGTYSEYRTLPKIKENQRLILNKKDLYFLPAEDQNPTVFTNYICGEEAKDARKFATQNPASKLLNDGLRLASQARTERRRFDAIIQSTDKTRMSKRQPEKSILPNIELASNGLILKVSEDSYFSQLPFAQSGVYFLGTPNIARSANGNISYSSTPTGCGYLIRFSSLKAFSEYAFDIFGLNETEGSTTMLNNSPKLKYVDGTVISAADVELLKGQHSRALAKVVEERAAAALSSPAASR